jgi:D-alanyl-D-alanine carboxypeptidase (penicillin-binding protein 5/6)
MIFSRRCFFALACGLSPVLFAASAKKEPSRPAAVDNAAAYKGAIVVDAATGNVLFEDRADYSGPPASMTKLMTFAVLHDKLAAGSIALNTPVRIAQQDNVGGTQVYLDPRETFPVEELIYAMMIQSANDAARSLARIAAGSTEAFVALMNEKARQLGMTRTTFRTPHGLPPSNRRVAEGDLTTPRDFALLCRHLLQHTDVLKYTSISNRDFGPERPKGAFKMENHNKLLGKVAGVDGLKTGFTDAAGYCISATAQRNGRRVIAIVMGSLGANGQRDYGRLRDIKTIELLERGFTALPPAPAAPSGAPVISEALIKPAPRQPAPAPSTAPAAPTEPPVKFSLPKK